MTLVAGDITGQLSGRPDGYGSGKQTVWMHQGQSYHKRLAYSPYTGASSGTCHFMRYGKHYWGTGNTHIYIYEQWYQGNSWGHFLLHGNTRSGNPSIHTVYNTGAPVPYATNYNSTYERSDIKFNHGSYYRYAIIVEVFESAYTASDGDVGHGAAAGGNSWHMYNSSEIF